VCVNQVSLYQNTINDSFIFKYTGNLVTGEHTALLVRYLNESCLSKEAFSLVLFSPAPEALCRVIVSTAKTLYIIYLFARKLLSRKFTPTVRKKRPVDVF